MRFSSFLIFIAIAVVPLWYVHRTLEEKRVRRLEWSEVFMTEPERQKKWAEEKHKAEDERIEKETELEKATAVRKAAETEAAKAQSELLQKKNAGAAEAARQRIEADRRAEEVASERAAKHQKIAILLKACADTASVAESRLKSLADEQKRYRAFIEEVSGVPIPQEGSVDRVTFSSAFRMLSHGQLGDIDDLYPIRKAKEGCESIASAAEGDPGYRTVITNGLESLETDYVRKAEAMRRSRSDIKDLVDFATGKLPDTFGGHIRRARAESVIEQSLRWREPQ